MFCSSSPPVVCRRAPVLFTLSVFVCYCGVLHILYSVYDFFSAYVASFSVLSSFDCSFGILWRLVKSVMIYFMLMITIFQPDLVLSRIKSYFKDDFYELQLLARINVILFICGQNDINKLCLRSPQLSLQYQICLHYWL